MKKKNILVLSLFMSLGSVISFASLTITGDDQTKAKALLQNLLFEAIRKGDLGKVKGLLSQGASLHEADDRGSTPLHFAALFKRRKIAEFLIHTGALVNARNARDGATPLHDAVSEQSATIIKLLLNCKADVSLCDSDGHTPLYEAQKKENTVIIELLLQADQQLPLASSTTHQQGESIDQFLAKCDNNMNKALKAAIDSDNVEYVKQLIIKGVDLTKANTHAYLPLHYAAKKGHASIINELIRAGVDKDTCIARWKDEGMTALHLAALHDCEGVVEVLIRAGANKDVVDKNKSTPLHYAARGKNKNIITLLLTDINKDLADKSGLTPFNYAVLAGHQDKGIIALLLTDTNKESLYANGVTPLAYAANKGYKGIVEILTEKGAKVNTVNTFGYTPLHYAIVNNCKDIVEILLEKGADKDACITNCFDEGMTPLHIAAQHCCDIIVDILLRAGAKVDARITNRLYKGMTPLHVAAQYGYDTVVDILLKAGADKDARVTNECDKGMTPLHYAAREGRKAVVKRLIEVPRSTGDIQARAKIDVQDDDGCTPLYFATKHGHTAIIDLLIAAGADREAVKEKKDQECITQ